MIRLHDLLTLLLQNPGPECFLEAKRQGNDELGVVALDFKTGGGRDHDNVFFVTQIAKGMNETFWDRPCLLDGSPMTIEDLAKHNIIRVESINFDRALHSLVMDTVTDCARNLVYYGRTDDAELTRAALQRAINTGTVTVDEMVDGFREVLTSESWGLHPESVEEDKTKPEPIETRSPAATEVESPAKS